MTTLEVSVDSAPRDWDEKVCLLGGAIFHSAAWANYQKCVKGGQPVFFLTRDRDGEVCAATLGLLHQSPWPILSRVFKELRLFSHPVSVNRDRVFAVDMIEHVEFWARGLGCRVLSLDSFSSADSPISPADMGYEESTRLEMVLDLRGEEESLWRGIKKDQRERIRRLEREEVRIELGTTLEDLEGLQATRESAQQRRSDRGQGYELEADRALYRGILDCLIDRKAARLFVARRHDEVIAALLIATFNSRAYSIFSGSSELGYQLGAQSGIFWSAVRMLKEEGFDELNRGGVPALASDPSDALHGIYRFKLRLGTVPRLCRSGTKTISVPREQLYLISKRLYQALQTGGPAGRG